PGPGRPPHPEGLLRRSVRRGTHRVAQDADGLDLQLDDVPGRELPAEVDSAAAPRRARPVDVARADLLGGRDMSDHVAPAPACPGGARPAPFLAVHPAGHPEVGLGPDLGGGDYAGAESVAEILALRGPEPGGHL